MQRAGFSGLLSQSFMSAVAAAFSSESPGLTLNQYPNGRPDLVPRAHYDGDAVKNGDEGVELKTSRSTSGWQGHNPEGGWLMVFGHGFEHQAGYVEGRNGATQLRPVAV